MRERDSINILPSKGLGTTAKAGVVEMKEKASTSETSSTAILTQKKMEAVCVYEGVEVQFSVYMIFIVELG